jgi:hypothetical protein
MPPVQQPPSPGAHAAGNGDDAQSDRAAGARGSARQPDSYGPEVEEEAGEATREAQEAHGGSMAPQIVDDTGRPLPG